jgi:hypothetical protein
MCADYSQRYLQTSEADLHNQPIEGTEKLQDGCPRSLSRGAVPWSGIFHWICFRRAPFARLRPTRDRVEIYTLKTLDKDLMPESFSPCWLVEPFNSN